MVAAARRPRRPRPGCARPPGDLLVRCSSARAGPHEQRSSSRPQPTIPTRTVPTFAQITNPCTKPTPARATEHITLAKQVIIIRWSTTSSATLTRNTTSSRQHHSICREQASLHVHVSQKQQHDPSLPDRTPSQTTTVPQLLTIQSAPDQSRSDDIKQIFHTIKTDDHQSHALHRPHQDLLDIYHITGSSTPSQTLSLPSHGPGLFAAASTISRSRRTRSSRVWTRWRFARMSATRSAARVSGTTTTRGR